jgi:hypothetical protein
MVGIQTRLALKRRALLAASRLAFWAERLRDEMKKQNVELSVREWYEGEPGNYRLQTDDSMTITLERREVRHLLYDLRIWSAELRRFAK